MKNILLLFIGFACSTNAYAAAITAQDAVTGGNTGGGGSFPHFIYMPGNNSGPTSTYLRLAGYTYGKNDGIGFVTADSTTYLFNSNSRGGYILPDEPTNDEGVMFDEAYSYRNTGSGFGPVLKKSQTYDIDMHVDNLTYSPWRKTGWEDSARYLYGYNNNRMTVSAFEVWMRSIWGPHIQSNISYNAAGRVSKMEATTYTMDFEYDGNNNLVSITDKQWTALTSWRNKTRQTFTYNSNGVATRTQEEWDNTSGAWMLMNQWEYTYFASKIETLTEFKRDGNRWLYVSRYIYAYNPDLQKKSEVYLVWHSEGNTFVNSRSSQFTYNSANLLVEISTSHWDGSNWVVGKGDEQYHYYYEPYFPTNVKNTTLATADVSIFPVPATNTLNLNIAWEKAESFTIAIYDMRGVVVKQWDEQANSAYTKQIDVANLPNGNYIIKANTASTQLTEKFIVAR